MILDDLFCNEFMISIYIMIIKITKACSYKCQFLLAVKYSFNYVCLSYVKECIYIIEQ